MGVQLGQEEGAVLVDHKGLPFDGRLVHLAAAAVPAVVAARMVAAAWRESWLDLKLSRRCSDVASVSTAASGRDQARDHHTVSRPGNREADRRVCARAFRSREGRWAAEDGRDGTRDGTADVVEGRGTMDAMMARVDTEVAMSLGSRLLAGMTVV